MIAADAKTIHLLRDARASIAVVALQLAACILPSVTQQTDPPATASTSESATRPASDASMSVAPDSGSAAPPVSEPSATADAGMSLTEPSASAAGSNAGSAGVSSMSTAGQGAAAGRLAGAPSAGKSGAASPEQPLALGELCRSAAQCASGRCADGVCCNATCEGECEECNALGSLGRCIKLDGVPDFDSCPDSRQVCGRGVCGLPNGDICGSDDECASAVCVWAGTCCAINCPICHRCASGGEDCEPMSGQPCLGNSVCDNGTCVPQ
jgi:hypothetical protein